MRITLSKPFTGLLALFVLATPVVMSPITAKSSDLAVPAHVARADDVFILRANCPTQPFHNRLLVTLPSTQHLGLENFTHHPETAPIQVVPVPLLDGVSALRLANDEHTWLAALDLGIGSRTLGLAMVKGQTPDAPWNNQHQVTGLNDGVFEECPTGYECIADQWIVDGPNADGEYTNLRYAGFGGAWVTMKDAPNSEGWHVYWKGHAGAQTITFDLVRGPFGPAV